MLGLSISSGKGGSKEDKKKKKKDVLVGERRRATFAVEKVGPDYGRGDFSNIVKGKGKLLFPARKEKKRASFHGSEKSHEGFSTGPRRGFMVGEGKRPTYPDGGGESAGLWGGLRI